MENLILELQISKVQDLGIQDLACQILKFSRYGNLRLPNKQNSRFGLPNIES